MRGWEDAAVWQLAAYLTAFSHAPEGARHAVQRLIEPRRAAVMIADLNWFAALLHLENGQLAAARRALTDAMAADAAAPSHRPGFALVTEWWAATLPLPYPDSTLERVRRTAESSDASLSRDDGNVTSGEAMDDPIWLALIRQGLGVAGRLEALRLYTIGHLSLRLGDRAAASAASASLARQAASDPTDWFVRAFDGELRARLDWYDGKPEQALRTLDELELGPVSVGETNIVPFLPHAHGRYLRGELLTALGRDSEALPWFVSLGSLSVPESAFRAPALLRRAEIHERLGNHAAAASDYARFITLWRDSDPEIQPLVSAARRRQTTLPNPAPH